MFKRLLRWFYSNEKIKKIEEREKALDSYVPAVPFQWWIDDLTHRVCGLIDHPELGLDKLPWPDNEKCFIAIDKRAYNKLEKKLLNLEYLVHMAIELDLDTDEIKTLYETYNKGELDE